MPYGKVAPGVTGVAMLPLTGNNDILLIVAASLIGLGVAVFAVSLVMARKNRQTSSN